MLSTNLRCWVSFHEPSLNALSKFSQTDLLWTSHSLNLSDDSEHSWVLSIDTLHCFWDNDCPEVCHQFLKINHNPCHVVSIICGCESCKCSYIPGALYIMSLNWKAFSIPAKPWTPSVLLKQLSWNTEPGLAKLSDLLWPPVCKI